MAIKHIKTASGFECDIDNEVLDDMEVLDDLAEIESGKLLKYPALITKLMGESGKRALYDHVRTEDGRVPYTAFEQEITEIFNALNAKN
jgi:hypothetical protein